ncbi:unnamed protein product [Paramecium sonneborni]|uniref:Myosin motor domain-containing protein n=1 Tax=Paramecium sonneborni TaxID=65129 RepID=A0A8S1MHA3_9CILI|nr:unnamed protein product [Paramecium sonneborni]
MEDFDDMVDMEIINDQELLVNLKKRYQLKKIFTYVGPTLLVINPFEACPHLINQETKNKYIQQAINKENRSTQPPHMYAIGAEAIKCLFENQKNQAIIISGESGAGKTENAKSCMNLITSVKFETPRQSQEKKNSINKFAIEDRILSCNPILEAFGNAKTLRNNNSSRFGKYTKIYISKKDKKIKGAQIYNYLLEKSRICLQGKGERNFHIFYHILKGMPINELQQLFLSENDQPIQLNKISYINTIQDVDGIDDKKLYDEVNQSYNLLGLESDKSNIHQIVAAVLHLGDLQFNDATLTDDVPCQIITENKLEYLSKLLQLNIKEISEALILKQRIINKQKIISPVSYNQCIQNRDSWAKELFERLFNWLVCKLNQNILPEEEFDINNNNTYIGLLDIYGFEVFDKNGFEQLIINYTNERLHQLYIQYVFKGEEIVFKEEGLDKFCQHIKYKDNQALIDCLDKSPLGIFDILDEVCQVGGDDDLLISNIRKKQKDPKYVLQPKMPSTQSFIIVHTARNVEYLIAGFREKNVDEISVLTAFYSEKSGNPLISKLFTVEDKQVQTVTKKDKSLSKKIRTQMNDLMKELTNNCDVHFVRCIKPNDLKKPQLLEDDYALQQIRYLGVLDSLKVRKQNYPFRRLHKQFYKQFGEITSNPLFNILEQQSADFRELNLQLFQQYFPKLGPELVLFGQKRIFIRIEGMDIIQQVFTEIMVKKSKIALKIQYNWHKYLIKKNLKRIHGHYQKIKLCNWSKALKAFQNLYYYQLRQSKMKLYQNQLDKILQYVYRLQAINYFDKIMNNIIIIQRQIQKWLFLKRIKKLVLVKYNINYIIDNTWQSIRLKKVLVIQSFFRGQRVRRIHKNVVIKSQQARLNKRNELAAIRIQKRIKGIQVREHIRKLNKAAFKIQGFVKMKWLSTTFKQIRMSTRKIQKLIRIYLIKQRAKNIKKEKYLKPLEEEIQQIIKIEENDLFGNNINQFSFDQILNQEDDQFRDKGQLFDIIVDLEILSDVGCYSPSFAQNYKVLFQQCYKNENIIQSVRVGSFHSIASTNANKLYVWGLNNEGQLGQGRAIDIPQQPQLLNLNVIMDQIECTDFNSYVKCHDGKLIIWGAQCQTISYVDIQPIKQISCRFDRTYIVTQQGQIQYWDSDHVIQNIATNSPISQVSIGLNFVALLTNYGQVMVKGTNEHGQLGLGDNLFRQELNQIKIPYKANLISCGLKHLSIQCCNGKAYVSGWNLHGQLGLGDLQDRWNIVQLKQEIQQICCSRTSTIILLENKLILWCGTNGFLKYQNEFVQLVKKVKYLQKLNPVRIQCSYSKVISLINITYAKLEKIKQPEKLKGILGTLTQKWIECNINSIDPPMIESVSNYLMHYHMKKPTSNNSQIVLNKVCRK